MLGYEGVLEKKKRTRSLSVRRLQTINTCSLIIMETNPRKAGG